MNEKDDVIAVEERHCRQSSLLSMFEEIAQTFLSSVSGERGNSKVFASLQDYLDGSVLIDGIYCRRRKVLLAIHDLKEELEAPPSLRSKTLAKLELLHVRPVPQVTFYQDIATAILRMEVVIRLEAMQAAQEESAPYAAGGLALALEKSPGRRRWPMWKLGTIGYGLAAVACCAGAIIIFSNGYLDHLQTVPPAQLAARGVETLPDATWRSPNCLLSPNDGMGRQIDGSRCAFGTSPAQRRSPGLGNAFNAAQSVMYSTLTEAGMSSAKGTSSRVASPVPEIPNQSPWATTVEASNIAGPALLSEVKTQ